MNAMELTSVKETEPSDASIAALVNLAMDEFEISWFTSTDPRSSQLKVLFTDDKVLRRACNQGLRCTDNNLFRHVINNHIASLTEDPWNQNQQMPDQQLNKALQLCSTFSIVAKTTNSSDIIDLLWTLKSQQTFIRNDLYKPLVFSLIMHNTKVFLNQLNNDYATRALKQPTKTEIPTLLDLCYNTILNDEKAHISQDAIHYIFDNIIPIVWNKNKISPLLLILKDEASDVINNVDLIVDFLKTKIALDKNIFISRVTDSDDKSEE
jgi:hypothetical protein